MSTHVKTLKFNQISESYNTHAENLVVPVESKQSTRLGCNKWDPPTLPYKIN